ncbi:MAG: FAD-dependent monooxygenase [Rhodobacteraceae bacterium]|jgi:2-polyprenyl-6-methoxyphenol hydroxylase-like FAD-dependent oxidoreductase|nr:FAD-dependent monooxygenase [Paracoccaceae bacterium]
MLHTAPAEPRPTDVLIAGAGPVGLALALDLGLRGIPTLVLDGDPIQATERRNRRANAINTRAMEYMRRLGVSPDIHRKAALARRAVRDVAFVTSLTGHELTRFVDAFESSPEPPPPGLSPEEYLRIDQDEIMAILRQHAAACASVRILERTRLSAFREETDGIHATTDTGLTLHARWLVGADGGASTVRRLSGIAFSGDGGRAQNLNITCRAAEVDAVNRHADAAIFWLVNPRADGFCGSDGQTFRLTLMDVTPDQEAAVRADPQPWIEAACGAPVSAEVLSIDGWTAHHLVASSYRRGRVFLAGDAAHLHPPTGGLGMNTGLGDASNLGWKLAAVAQGWGGEALLDSYSDERRPHGATVVAQANLQYDRRPAAFHKLGLEDAGPAADAVRAATAAEIRAAKMTEFFSRGLVLGQTYRSSVIVDAGEPVINRDIVTYVPTAQPGARLPHAMLGQVSVYDLLSPERCTLLAVGDEGRRAAAATLVAAAAAAVPLHLVECPQDCLAGWEYPLLILRPDGHVAWRGRTAPDGAVLRQIAGKAPAGVSPAVRQEGTVA